jgi:prolipoprotein diacylglyceryltransferase
MSAAVVIGVLALGLAILFAWAFHCLPSEKWQILAALPREREPDGDWRGVNLTYYGVFNALAVGIAVALAVFLPGTVGLPLAYLAGCVVAFLAVVLSASKLLNRLVEGHWHGFTVGGGCFAGMAAGPWVIWGVSRLALPAGDAASAVPYVLGALAPAYALGEGIGRLACISFGCCYGRPLADCPVSLRALFGRWAFVFEGRLKKSSYAHGYEGQRLIPVQALTAILSSLAGLAGTALFLSGRPVAAFVLAIVATQVWRFLSEFLRADYRGASRISAYQWMALAGAAYTVLLGWLWPDVPERTPDVARGLALLWTPGALLLIQAVAIFVFVRMGVSTVTTSLIAFDLRQDRVAPPLAERVATKGAVAARPSGPAPAPKATASHPINCSNLG